MLSNIRAWKTFWVYWPLVWRWHLKCCSSVLWGEDGSKEATQAASPWQESTACSDVGTEITALPAVASWEGVGPSVPFCPKVTLLSVFVQSRSRLFRFQRHKNQQVTTFLSADLIQWRKLSCGFITLNNDICIQQKLPGRSHIGGGLVWGCYRAVSFRSFKFGILVRDARVKVGPFCPGLMPSCSGVNWAPSARCKADTCQLDSICPGRG